MCRLAKFKSFITLLTWDYSEKVDDKTPIPPPDWEALIEQVAEEIMAEHSPARILQVRAKLYDLISHCIPPTTILKVRLTTSHATGRGS